MRAFKLASIAIGAASALAATGAAAKDLAGVACTTPPPARCEGEACSAPGGALANLGNATDAKTRRKFFLDFPCDLKPNEKVVFVLNLHGAGSIGNWQRHYFPAADYKDKYRLVVATPTAATATPVRRWDGAADDAHLQNISEMVLDAVGRGNVKSYWLAGHSQGGFTSRRIVCTPYFANKVDGWLSLSGGRVGQAPFVAAFGPPRPDGTPPAARPAPTAAATAAADAAPTCDFSHIFAVGQYEIDTLPTTSPLAQKYACGPRTRREIADSKPGYVWDYDRAGYKVWGTMARPGTAEVFTYGACKDGRVIADVVRLDKGHTEGLEPKVTEELVKMMVAIPGEEGKRGK